MRLIIGVDIDNVLNNLTEAVLSVYNSDSGDNLSLSDITAYHIENFVKPAYKENFWHYFLDKRVWKRISIIDGCREVIAKLYNEGHTILFITTTEAENLPKKKNWLQRNFPFLEIRKCLYSCPRKQYMRCDILIDDCLKNLVGDKEYYSVCLTYPWNTTELEESVPMFTRAKDWNEIYNKVKMIETLLKEDENE